MPASSAITALLFLNFAMPSLALQAQKQTHAADVLKELGASLRGHEVFWMWSGGQTCTDACKSQCDTAVCNPEAPCSISSAQAFENLEGKLQIDFCTSFDETGSAEGPYWQEGSGVCYPTDGGCNYDHCDKVPKQDQDTVCACNADLSTCTVSEDPHVNVFDGAQVSLLFGNKKGAKLQEATGGDQWLVSSERVKIQARYMKKGDSPSSEGLFTRAIALGGEILKGNVMVIGALEDDITWNGKPILRDQESHFRVHETSFSVDAARGPSSLVQDLSQENPGVTVRLEGGISLIVNRLHRYINVAIKMPQQAGGQEGICGNFNGIGADDAEEMVAQRFDVSVAPEESLFTGISFE